MVDQPKTPATDAPTPLPTPGVPLHFDMDAAIAHQLAKVPDADLAEYAVVFTGEKVAGGPAKARVALVYHKDGDWDVSAKVYAEVEQHLKPTVGVEVVLIKKRER